MNRRNLFKSGVAAYAVACLPFAARAEQVLAQMEMLVPSGPGGGWDTTGRSIDSALREGGLIGGSRIQNVPGAGGTVGLATFVNQFAGNPSAVMVGGLVMVSNIIANKSPVDLSMTTPLARLTGEYEAVAVPADSPYATIQDLIADFTAKPGTISWVGGSAGGIDHVVVGLISQACGVPAASATYVGYPSGGEIQTAVLGAQATAGVSGLSEFIGHAEGGGMRILAVTAPERIPGIDVPTLKEAGLDIEVINWRGLFGAAEISAEERAALEGMITEMVAGEAWQRELKARNWTGLHMGGEEFAAFIADEAKRIEGVLKDLGLA